MLDFVSKFCKEGEHNDCGMLWSGPEFQKLHSSAVRAYQLITLMYNRLTLIEKFSHKEAITKIQNDHKHLAGFSKRNIRRSLPLDNPYVPRRARPRWPKNSIAIDDDHSKLS